VQAAIPLQRAMAGVEERCVYGKGGGALLLYTLGPCIVTVYPRGFCYPGFVMSLGKEGGAGAVWDCLLEMLQVYCQVVV